MIDFANYVQLAISIVVLVYYLYGFRKSGFLDMISFGARRSAESTASFIEYKNSRTRVFCREDDNRMNRIISSLKSTLQVGFVPTFWAHDQYGQLLLLLVWRYYYRFRAHGRFKKEVLICSDGGQVAIEKYVHPGSENIDLRDDAPVLIIFHSIAGRSRDAAELAEYAFMRGMRPIFLSRRGHFDELLIPKFNVMGSLEDSILMLNYIREQYPNSFIGAVGISAGSVQLVNLIGNQSGFRNLIDAGVVACPAYDIEKAMKRLKQKSPFVEKFLLGALKRFFLYPNINVLREVKGFKETYHSTTVHEFVENHIHLAGFKSIDEYFQKNNPMSNFSKNNVPCLIINAIDDPLSLEANIPYDVVLNMENYALVLTESGSHVAFRDGMFGQGSWIYRTAVNFLLCAEGDSRLR